MNIDKMTSKAQEALRTALAEATRRGNPEVLPEHICLAVIEQEGGVGRPLVSKAGGDRDALAAALESRIASLPQVSGGAEPRFSRRALDLMTGAEEEARRMKD